MRNPSLLAALLLLGCGCRYGESIQLQHVKSGAFLSALASAAQLDPECRGLELSAMGTSACVFKLMPRFKAQSEGGGVYYSHAMRIESVKQHGFCVHMSPHKPYSPIPDSGNPALPKCLQTGKTLEMNLSTEVVVRWHAVKEVG